ncbi:oligosaccharide flippase family protein [Prosthecochloris sp. N3]|uniref:Oligosaccharide flippase family protein n=1 Tax=Prosthecochloris ethylica TaxID=2743976 RepID=A0ABR9XUA0_9CHLB|nr:MULTISPECIES: oligosaccharide flippase family protein [Prosthecochloris]MEC9486199.1 oligosaccharide flippase family protein [Prosthecochloris sp.]MBF0586590.1 oligosaccharide flippase family protein [Prosthecochloris ethylica]MBF0637513.1 oligosaccharide flippase family protein [Prosthecochloris ethylica]NUK47662.1 oligosaccharide flippase family protein [Prosthecochloris ethylica]RNA64332.1 polysaccharide biosynthesis protein [Prosthecochloris sp. ZM_2]
MLDKLRLLAKDTVIYGASTILARGLNYVLVPLYANLLTTFENGVHALVYANIALANVLFAYGMETAYLKSGSEALRQEGGSSGYFSTALYSLLLTSTLFAGLIVLFAPALAVLLGLSAAQQEFIRYAAVILWLDALLVVPFADLRLKRKALRFAAAKVVGVVVVVMTALVLIVGFDRGLEGAFLANIAGSAVSLLFVLPSLKQLRRMFSPVMLREMLSVGLPYVPTGIAGLLIHLIDRNILIRMPQESVASIYGDGTTPSDVVGIYGRVAAFGIILQLFIQVFRFAWQPFFLQHADDPDAGKLFRHVLSISTLFTMLVALSATFFVPDLVRFHIADSFYLLPPPYWVGLSILPWIFCSYVFDMVSTNLTAGILITGSTRYLPVVTFAGAAVTATVCWFLVPVYGMDGAAAAILAGTVVMCCVMAYFSLKVYPNSYAWGRLLLLFAAGVATGAVPPLLGCRALWFEVLLVLGYFILVVVVFRREANYVLKRVLPSRAG